MTKSDKIIFPGSAELAQRIRSARARGGITRKQLAAAASASERYLATLEKGEGNPSVEMLMAIASALNVPTAELLPAGGERDASMGEAISKLRRLSSEQLHEVMMMVGGSPIGGEDKGRRITLIGLRGAGKSSLGEALANRLHVPFFEISKEVERVYGGSMQLLLEINGPAALRRYEGDILDRIYREHKAAVIAAPGAIVSDPPEFDRLLRSSWTIWLQATPEDHMQRVVAQGDLRPMAGNRAAMNDLKTILSAREADYARADMRLDTSRQDFATTLNLLEQLTHTFR